MKRKEARYSFSNKRNYNIITPCCNSSNKDGKFVSYEQLPIQYGFCHSCGKAILPATIYLDENGSEFIWNNTTSKYEPATSFNNTFATVSNKVFSNKDNFKKKPAQKYISENKIWETYQNPENNLLKYLRKQYPTNVVEAAKKEYVLGTTNDGGTIFWQINKDLQVQKNKVCYYKTNGKRTNTFIVNYKNDDGYYSCLYGEHLLTKYKNLQKIILVESEKTAIVGSINLPNYTWLAYGGLTQLTDEKVKVLKGYSVLSIPDISNKAVNQISKKLNGYKALGINISLWDLTYGLSDKELKSQGIYNCDLEDIIRKIRRGKIS